MSGLLTNGVVQLGIGGLIVLAVVLGYLMPKSTAKLLVDRADRNAAQWERAYHRETDRADREADRADLAAKQTGELLVGMSTVEKLVRSLLAARETR